MCKDGHTLTWYWELRGGLRTLEINYASLTMRIGIVMMLMMISILNIIVIGMIMNSGESTCDGEVGAEEFVMIPAAGGGAA